MKTDMGQSPESTDGQTPSEITNPPIEVGKGKVEPEKITTQEIDDAARELGLKKIGAATIKRLSDIGIAAEQYGAIKMALGRVVVSDDRLDRLMEVVLDVAENSEEPETQIKAAVAGSSLAQQISKNADLVYRMQNEKMIQAGSDKRKFQSFGPDHVVVPVQSNVQVNLSKDDES
jgi:hypothetical protein